MTTASPSTSPLANVIVKVLADPKTTEKDLLAVASLAEKSGQAKTAEALRDRARKLMIEQAAAAAATAIPKIGESTTSESETEPASEPASPASEPASPASEPERNSPLRGSFVGFPSPWKDVPPPAWTAFVKAMGDKKAKAVDDRYRLGIFGIGARRLVDLGLMKNPKKGEYKGAKGVWVAEWLPPHSEEKFLGSPEAQYRAFVASMIAYRRAINQQFAGKPAPAPVGGKRVSLSGLLAVAHHAGMGGLGKWLSDERRVPATTEAFTKATEIF
jgi:hypothetical protein